MNDQRQSDMNNIATNNNRKNPYTIWFVVLSFIAPVVLAYIIFYFVDVTSFTNRGEIFKPVIAIETLGLRDETGTVIPKEKLTYKWRIYSFVGSHCDEDCNKRLYDVKQIRTRLGKNAHRLLQVIVHFDPADTSLTELIKTEYPDALNLYGDEDEIAAAIKNDAQLRDNEIYFMDPMGNIMMRFTKDQPVGDINFDLRKLLKASQIG